MAIAQENPLLEGLQIRRAPDDCILVIFGASGDLARHKLLPSLYNLAEAGNLPEPFSILGVARPPMEQEVYRVDMNLRLTRYAPATPVELPTPPLAPPGPDVYQDFLLAVAGERPPAVSGREAADMLRIIEAVYASAELGRAVPISTPVRAAP